MNQWNGIHLNHKDDTYFILHPHRPPPPPQSHLTPRTRETSLGPQKKYVTGFHFTRIILLFQYTRSCVVKKNETTLFMAHIFPGPSVFSRGPPD